METLISRGATTRRGGGEKPEVPRRRAAPSNDIGFTRQNQSPVFLINREAVEVTRGNVQESFGRGFDGPARNTEKKFLPITLFI